MILLREFIEAPIKLYEDENKNYFLSGPFMQTEIKNRNGRVYPRGIMEGEVRRWQPMIGQGRLMGECGHPDSPSVNLDRVSHLVTELKLSHNDVHGKAKLMPTPMGGIIKGLSEGGAKLGMSSRGLGSLKEKAGVKYVADDFQLAAIDCVSDPSGPDCFVEGLYEGVHWIMEKGDWVPEFRDEGKEQIDRAVRQREDFETAALQLFESFLGKI